MIWPLEVAFVLYNDSGHFSAAPAMDRGKLPVLIFADNQLLAKPITWSTSTLVTQRQTTFTDKTAETVTSDNRKMTRNTESQTCQVCPLWLSAAS